MATRNDMMATWNVLDVGSIWMKEFASALSEREKVNAWVPRFGLTGALTQDVQTEESQNPPLKMRSFPLQRGYARAPLRWLLPYQAKLLRTILAETPDPSRSPLVCSTPFYAPVAERWPGPVVYYVTDLTVAYPSVNPDQVRRLDRRMCRVATAVCPNSLRIADYLQQVAGCEQGKITIVPNATRASNVAQSPQFEPGPLPMDMADLPRPIVGVLGDLSGNLDWKLVLQAVKLTPELNWVFVGPANKSIPDEEQSRSREAVKQLARFVGMKPYGELHRYARCFDVAVLPYRKCEPTYSGSSTRFYEHLAAGRPMVGTPAFAELLEKTPLLQLANTAEEMVFLLKQYQANGFHDGQETARWEASQKGTWAVRAEAMVEALERHRPGPPQAFRWRLARGA